MNKICSIIMVILTLSLVLVNAEDAKRIVASGYYTGNEELNNAGEGDLCCCLVLGVQQCIFEKKVGVSYCNSGSKTNQICDTIRKGSKDCSSELSTKISDPSYAATFTKNSAKKAICEGDKTRIISCNACFKSGPDKDKLSQSITVLTAENDNFKCSEYDNPTYYYTEGQCGVTPSKSPCPSLYSVTTTGDKLEETFIEAQYIKNMDDYYYTKLDNFDEKIGKIILKEEMLETAYIDSVSLLKVTNAVNPMITGNGDIVNIIGPQEVKCVNKYGIDCTNKLKSKDSKQVFAVYGDIIDQTDYADNAYSSDLAKINLEDKETYTDYLELTLPETKSNFANLIISYSQTKKIPSVQDKMFLGNTKLSSAFFSAFELPLFRDVVKDKVTQLSRVIVKVKDSNGKWVRYDDTGNSAFVSFFTKDTVVVMDNSKIRDNQVRIEFVSGMYAFDYIAVDYNGDKVSYEEVPIKDIAFNGVVLDKTGLLNKDGIYQKMFIGDEAEISFDMKPSANSHYFLRTSGYYHPGIIEKEEVLSNEIDLEKAKDIGIMIFSTDYGMKQVLKYLLEN